MNLYRLHHRVREKLSANKSGLRFSNCKHCLLNNRNSNFFASPTYLCSTEQGPGSSTTMRSHAKSVRMLPGHCCSIESRRGHLTGYYYWNRITSHQCQHLEFEAPLKASRLGALGQRATILGLQMNWSNLLLTLRRAPTFRSVVLQETVEKHRRGARPD